MNTRASVLATSVTSWPILKAFVPCSLSDRRDQDVSGSAQVSYYVTTVTTQHLPPLHQAAHLCPFKEDNRQNVNKTHENWTLLVCQLQKYFLLQISADPRSVWTAKVRLGLVSRPVPRKDQSVCMRERIAAEILVARRYIGHSTVSLSSWLGRFSLLWWDSGSFPYDQDTGKPLQSTPLTRLALGHKLCKFINYIKTLQNEPNAQQTLTDGQDTTTTYKNATDQIS